MSLSGSQTSGFRYAYDTGPGTSLATSSRVGRPGATAGTSSMSNLMGLIFGVSAITSLTSAISESLSQKALMEAQKSSFEINSRLANLQAKDAIKRGDKEADLHAKRIKRLIGTQRAGLAAQGIEIDTGSALDIQLDTAEIGAIDVETIRNNAYRESWGIKVQALDVSSQGNFSSLATKAKARNTLIAGGLQTLNLGLSYYKSTSLEDFLT